MLNANHDFVARAQAYAAQHRTPERRLCQPGPVNTVEKTIASMADDMIDIAAAKGSCEDTDLLVRGWSVEAVRKHGDAARDRANARAGVRG